MSYEDRVRRYLWYYYLTGVADGTYLTDVPYYSLAGHHRADLKQRAEFAASTGLLPRREMIGGTLEYQWVLEERREV